QRFAPCVPRPFRETWRGRVSSRGSSAGLSVCVLADSMLKGMEHAFPHAHFWVHPGTTLERATYQQLYHFLSWFPPSVPLYAGVGTPPTSRERE
ncbi:hypothetical protein DPEC_G00015800, partial [Dallia pectoralis]